MSRNIVGRLQVDDTGAADLDRRHTLFSFEGADTLGHLENSIASASI
jgi:hypothetical protein